MTTIREAVERHALKMAAEIWPEKTIEPERVETGPRAWFVVQSAVRAEKKAKQVLVDDGHEVYLPTVRIDIRHHRTGCWLPREFLMFNRYLFARLPCDTRQWRTILEAEPIAHVLGVDGAPQAIADTEILRFMQVQASGAFDDVENSRTQRMLQNAAERKEFAKRTYARGSTIRATKGPFGGFSGLVTSVTGRGTVMAMVRLFKRLTPVEFHLDDIEVAA